MVLPGTVPNPNRYCVNVDIPHADFHTSDFIRDHALYKKFTQSNGWGYFELLGKGSLEDDAKWVMKEFAEKDRDYSKPFQVEWLKVVHMPFMLFDKEGRSGEEDER